MYPDRPEFIEAQYRCESRMSEAQKHRLLAEAGVFENRRRQRKQQAAIIRGQLVQILTRLISTR